MRTRSSSLLARCASWLVATVAVTACGSDSTGPVAPANLLSSARFPDCAQLVDYFPTGGWRLTCPAVAGMDSARLRLAYEAMNAAPDVRAFVVVRHGHVVAEAYRTADDSRYAFHQQSATKSVTSALVGIAIGRGELPGTDATLGATLPQYMSPGQDALLPGITVGQLLSMSSGLSGPPTGPPPLMLQLLARPVARTPGTTFEYDDGGYHLLSVVLRVATDADVREYANRHLFGPLGFGVGSDEWATDDLRIQLGSTGLRLSAREMAKLGMLYLHDGAWDGERILPEDWVQRSWTPQQLEGLPSGGLSYGLGWWIADYDGHDAFFAAGHGGQTITVVPDLDLVVVIAANPQSPGEWQRFRRVIPDHVIPAIAGP